MNKSTRAAGIAAVFMLAACGNTDPLLEILPVSPKAAYCVRIVDPAYPDTALFLMEGGRLNGKLITGDGEYPGLPRPVAAGMNLEEKYCRINDFHSGDPLRFFE